MANGNTYYLQGTTNLEDLFESFDANEDLEPIIECSGFDLVLNENCDAADPDGKIYNITIQNSSSENKLILEDKSRIRLAASLPSNTSLWINPDKPLPYYDELTGSYETKFTANARCEIQLNGNFGLGSNGGNLPTETRPGGFLAKIKKWIDTSTFQLEENSNINLHPNDMIEFTSYNSNYAAAFTRTIASYNSETKIIILATPAEGSYVVRKDGQYIGLIAGGVTLVNPNNNWTISVLQKPMICGTLNFVSVNTGGFSCTNSILKADRIGMAVFGFSYGDGQPCALCADNASVIVGQFVGYVISRPSNKFNAKIGEACCTYTYSRGTSSGGDIVVNGGHIDMSLYSAFSQKQGVPMILKNVDLYSKNTPSFKTAIYYNNCSINGVTINEWTESTGTVTCTKRNDLDPSIELPDAWYHVPSNSSVVTWRYEDVFVRAGESIRYHVYWMPSTEGAIASVAFTDNTIWWPDIMKLGLDLYPNIKFEAGLQNLHWYSKLLSWTNASNEDKQIRVWECVTGATPGGYLRTWRASGGIL